MAHQPSDTMKEEVYHGVRKVPNGGLENLPEKCSCCKRNNISPLWYLDFNFENKLCEDCYMKNKCVLCNIEIPEVYCSCQKHICYNCSWRHHDINRSHELRSNNRNYEMPGSNKIILFDNNLIGLTKRITFPINQAYNQFFEDRNAYLGSQRQNFSDERKLAISYLENLLAYIQNSLPNYFDPDYIIHLGTLYFSSGNPTKAIRCLMKIKDFTQDISQQKWRLFINYLDIKSIKNSEINVSDIKENIKSSGLKGPEVDRFLFIVNHILGSQTVSNFSYSINRTTIYQYIDNIRISRLEQLNIEILDTAIHFSQVYMSNFVIASEICELKSDYFRKVVEDLNSALQCIEKSIEICYRNSKEANENLVKKILKLSKILFCMKDIRFFNSISEEIKLACQLKLKKEAYKGFIMLENFYMCESNFKAARLVKKQRKLINL